MIYFIVYIVTIVVGLILSKWMKAPEPFYVSLLPAFGTVLFIIGVCFLVLFSIFEALKIDKLKKSFEKWIEQE